MSPEAAHGGIPLLTERSTIRSAFTMVNERKTENIVRSKLREADYYSSPGVVVEEQKSDSQRIAKLLKNASKKGAGQGYPEFIISSETLSDFLIVIECKADPTKHVSKDGDRYAEYAVDGVLLYAAFLSKAFDVLAIAVSGETTATLRMSHYLHLRGASQPVEFVTPDIIPFNAFYEKVTHSDIKFRQDYDALLSFSPELNENLQAKKSRKLTVGFLYAEFLLPLRTPRSREALGCRRQPSILQTILSNRS